MEKELLELYLDGMDIVLLSSHLNLNPLALGSACLRGCFLELQLKITTIYESAVFQGSDNHVS